MATAGQTDEGDRASLQLMQQLLVSTLDPRQQVREQAEQQLVGARDGDFSLFLISLARVLDAQLSADPLQVQEQLLAKQIAAVTFKNCISAKDVVLDSAAADKWRAVAEAAKQAMRLQLLAAIKTEHIQVANAVCQVLSKIGRIELPGDGFPELLPFLLTLVTEATMTPEANAQADGVSVHRKVFGRNALTCLSYLCEEHADIVEETGEDPADVLSEAHCNNILTAVVQGMKDEDVQLKVAALKALYHALIFSKKNFENQTEREYIIQVVLENTKVAHQAVQVSAFECLVKVAEEYYSMLEPYMSGVGPLSWEALKSGDASVCIAAMELWNTIADVEIDIQQQEEEAAALGADGAESAVPRNCHIVKQALPFLLPILLNTLTQQDSEETDAADSWTAAMAAGTCLGLCAQVVKNDILPPVIQFVSENFASPDWTRREAAVLAFGSVMEGPDTEALKPLVEESFASLVDVLQDSSVAVRDTAAWTLGRIAQFHTPVVLQKLVNADGTVVVESNSLLAAIVRRLLDQPRVAVNVCWLLHELADHMTAGDGERPASTPLDPLFQRLCDALIQVSERADADERSLRDAAFNCLGALINNAGESCKPSMLKLLDHFVQQLSQSFMFEANEATRQRQGLLCGVIQILCLRLGDQVQPVASQIWACLARIFRGSPPANAPPGTAGQLSCSASESITNDALLATSALVNASGPSTAAFAEDIVCIIASGLENSTGSAAGSSGGGAGAAAATSGSSTTDELQTVRICVELVGDVSRALGPAFAPYSGPLLARMYQMLQDPNVERALKPCVMVAVGDAAMTMGGEAFAPYLDSFMAILHQAGNTTYDVGPSNWQVNEEWLWYIHDLREGVLQAYMSIVYSFKEKCMQEQLKLYVNAMLDVVKAVAATSPKMRGVDENVKQAIELVGDLISTYGGDLTLHLQRAPFMEQLLQLAQVLGTVKDAGGEACLQKAQWLRQLMARYS
ncbi:HEAT repeat-containing protein [Toxoplasma gondii RUB]|uniref:HEAT repeat-containing protein n=3 Tax=Toxoplasma gondii TaxID=5811 RepID=A0A086LSH0_TOXGO|nr:HEAT repeat-containing protein [Toxoplasma gondii RUB]KFH03425.1 HEAT repeat-containing protein [Toxoplasma gondii VAND]KYF39655.1 HEAT repeat-containing protein [Toxoplasma gondii ARI]